MPWMSMPTLIVHASTAAPPIPPHPHKELRHDRLLVLFLVGLPQAELLLFLALETLGSPPGPFGIALASTQASTQSKRSTASLGCRSELGGLGYCSGIHPSKYEKHKLPVPVPTMMQLPVPVPIMMQLPVPLPVPVPIMMQLPVPVPIMVQLPVPVPIMMQGKGWEHNVDQNTCPRHYIGCRGSTR
eukprot:1162009-Pelagomonas_calceolata.AAC.10